MTNKAETLAADLRETRKAERHMIDIRCPTCNKPINGGKQDVGHVTGIPAQQHTTCVHCNTPITMMYATPHDAAEPNLYFVQTPPM